MIQLSDSVRYDKRNIGGSLEVFDASLTSVRENWIHRERFLFYDELIYLQKGSLYLSVNGENYALKEGSFFFTSRYSTICGYKRSDGLCSFYTISYESNLAVISEMELCPLRVVGNPLYIDELIKRLYSTVSASSHDKNKSGVLLMSLIYELVDTALKPSAAKPLMQRTMEYINANISNPITVETVCSELNYNRDYVSKQFLAHYGITIKRYIDQKKIAVSKQLLLTSKMSLAQISAAVGFESAGQFYKFFKYHEKLSPTEFRERNT